MYLLDNSPGRIANVNDKEYLFFSGYSYLGMSHVAAFTTLVKEGIDIYGLIHPSARLSNTQLKIYEQFERQLSIINRTDETVTFSSGYLAGRAIIDLFKNKNIYLLPDTHPVLQNEQSISAASIQALVDQVNENNEQDIVIACDMVNPLKSTIQTFDFLHSIDKDKKIICIIDNSHGAGLIDESNKEIFARIRQRHHIELVITYSLSKAFHISGGALSCSKAIANQLRRSPFYTASTAIAPPMIYAFLKGADLYKSQQKKLELNIKTFTAFVRDLPSLSYHPQLPIFVLPESLDDAFFRNHQVIISSFAYPNPMGKKINRIVLNALHTEEDLKKLSEIIHAKMPAEG